MMMISSSLSLKVYICLYLFGIVISSTSVKPTTAMIGATIANGDAYYVEAWNRYVDRTIRNAPNGTLQPSCVPKRVSAQTNGSAFGVVVLFHGYSACPQQWDLLSAEIAKRGYDVLLPLNPGHGNVFPSRREEPERRAKKKKTARCLYGCAGGPLDDMTHFPVNVSEWKSFVEEINAVVSLVPENMKRAVAGLSVGGVLAALAGTARGVHDADESLYGTQLIMNPMIELTSWHDTLLRLLDTLPLTRDDFVGWGEGCREERAAGRGGVCTFLVENGFAARKLGTTVLKQLTNPGSNATVAVVYDRGDPVVRTTQIRDLANVYDALGGVSKGVRVTDTTTGRRIARTAHGTLSTFRRSCVLNFTQHSMLSRWDDIHVDKWWMSELTCRLADYLTTGIPIEATSATAKDEGGENVCVLNCTEATCAYNRSTPSVTCGGY